MAIVNNGASEYGQLGGIKDADMGVRSGFVRKVYGILTAQLLLTICVAGPIATHVSKEWVQQNVWVLGLSVGMTFVTLFAMTCFPQLAKTVPTNYILLFAFTFFEGIMIGIISASYTWQSVCLAAGMTLCIVASMTVYACTTTSDFTGMGPYLFVALMSMCAVGLMACIMSMCGVDVKPMMYVYDGFGALLFTMYLVYDTQMIMGGNHKVQFDIDEYVFAALNLYLDIINIFLYLLELFGDRK